MLYKGRSVLKETKIAKLTVGIEECKSNMGMAAFTSISSLKPLRL